MQTLKTPLYSLQTSINQEIQNLLLSTSSTCDSVANKSSSSSSSSSDNYSTSPSQPTQLISSLNLNSTTKNETDDCDSSNKSHIYGYLMGLLCALCFSLTSIIMKQCSTLVGSEHSLIRYILQLFMMLFLIKYKNIAVFGPKKEQPILLLRALLSILTILLVFFSSKYLYPSDLMTLGNLSIIFTAFLSRIVLKEKLTIVHIVALLLTIIGIACIYRPVFLFHSYSSSNDKIHNETTHSSFDKRTFISDENIEFMPMIEQKIHLNPSVGRLFVILAAIVSSVTHILTKRLISNNIDFSVVLFYPSLIGVPISLIISSVLVVTNKTHMDFSLEWKLIIIDVIYSSMAATIAIFAVIVFCISHKYDDVSKISIIKSLDIVFSFLFQYLFLNIRADLFGIFGSMCIILGISIIFMLKLLKKKLPTVTGFVKFISYKF